MKTPDYFNLLVAPDKMRIRGSGWLRTAIVVVFVGLMALFFTAPVSHPTQHDKTAPQPR